MVRIKPLEPNSSLMGYYPDEDFDRDSEAKKKVMYIKVVLEAKLEVEVIASPACDGKYEEDRYLAKSAIVKDTGGTTTLSGSATTDSKGKSHLRRLKSAEIATTSSNASKSWNKKTWDSFELKFIESILGTITDGRQPRVCREEKKVFASSAQKKLMSRQLAPFYTYISRMKHYKKPKSFHDL